MTLTLMLGGVAVLLLILLVWLARSPSHPLATDAAAIPQQTEALHELHCHYFPQVRQALSREDREFVRQRGSRRLQREARQARLHIARSFVSGLREDLLRLERMGRMVAALSPRVERRQEWDRIKLGLRFRVLYAGVQTRLSLGDVPVPQLAELADLIGTRASRLERALAALDAGQRAQTTSSLNA